MNKIGIILISCLFSMHGFSKEFCTINQEYRINSDYLRTYDGTIRKILKTDTWEDCYRAAIKIARENPIEHKIVIALSGNTEPKIENPQYIYTNVFKWTFNDSILFFNTKGRVSRNNNLENPEAGNIALDKDGYLLMK